MPLGGIRGVPGHHFGTLFGTFSCFVLIVIFGTPSERAFGLLFDAKGTKIELSKGVWTCNLAMPVQVL